LCFTSKLFLPQVEFSRPTVRKRLVSQPLSLSSEKLVSNCCFQMGQLVPLRLGITSPLPNALSLALGSCETTPLEMCVAYATIAAGGVYSKPHLITKVRDRTGSVIYRHKGSRRLAANAGATSALHGMLRAVVTRGTGQNAAAGWPAAAVAGKTGTSDEYRDAWFAG
jgi:penicillin-binding protein 1A